MKSNIILVFGSLLFFLSCDNNYSVNTGDSETKEVENFIVRYYEVMSSRNWSAYQEFFSEQAVLTTIWQDSTNTGLQIFTSSISDFITQTDYGPDSQPIFEENPINIDVEIKNGLASVWVKYEAKFGSENELIEWKGYDLFSLLKFNSKWHITSITYLSDE